MLLTFVAPVRASPVASHSIAVLKGSGLGRHISQTNDCLFRTIVEGHHLFLDLV